MFKVQETNVVSMKDLQLFFRVHFGSEAFVIYNEDNLTEIEFTIPKSFKFSNPSERAKHMMMLKRIHKIYEADQVDLRSSHVVVYYLAMLGVLDVSGHCRIVAIGKNGNI